MCSPTIIRLVRLKESWSSTTRQPQQGRSPSPPAFWAVGSTGRVTSLEQHHCVWSVLQPLRFLQLHPLAKLRSKLGCIGSCGRLYQFSLSGDRMEPQGFVDPCGYKRTPYEGRSPGRRWLYYLIPGRWDWGLCEQSVIPAIPSAVFEWSCIIVATITCDSGTTSVYPRSRV